MSRRLSYTLNEILKSELMHYGVKGMKWGVRRTREQLGHPSKRLKSPIVGDMIKAGLVSTKVNRDKQNKHLFGNQSYDSRKSWLFGSVSDAQKLINDYSGTGDPIMSNGRWQNKERISLPHVVGVHVNSSTGKETRTNKAIITYSKTGSHIYPAQHKKGD